MERVNTDRVLGPQKKPGLYEPLCTLVTQLLNPVRPKWLRPSRHLKLAAHHSDCLRRHCARHMLAVSLSPHIHMCGNLLRARAPTTTGIETLPVSWTVQSHLHLSLLVSSQLFFLLVKFTNGVNFKGFFTCSYRHSWEGCGWGCYVSCSLSSCPIPLNIKS